ncbi:hypothetical protein DAPPUDRAFT_260332 [Daphnia pulex]|uniref:Uncharacterized protein n=1 Tax=Daphnia pulex TaxID=6669 RepID=E9HIZ0_DAPPU|nr:hypothetical protein DAPPUDRAFT_260332 [Daphnia pulex]|eukprot:EFX68304.1 hypothetical protein DAPPUDRAFT_260332 [Daphnia pulex]
MHFYEYRPASWPPEKSLYLKANENERTNFLFPDSRVPIAMPLSFLSMERVSTEEENNREEPHTCGQPVNHQHGADRDVGCPTTEKRRCAVQTLWVVGVDSVRFGLFLVHQSEEQEFGFFDYRVAFWLLVAINLGRHPN